MTSGQDDRQLAFSRPTGVAQALGSQAPDRHRFLDKRVLLTGEVESLAQANGRMLLLDALRLLVRMTPNVTVALPSSADALRREAEALARRIEFGGVTQFPRTDVDPAAFDAVLSIGHPVVPGLPWTSILCE